MSKRKRTVGDSKGINGACKKLMSIPCIVWLGNSYNACVCVCVCVSVCV